MTLTAMSRNAEGCTIRFGESAVILAETAKGGFRLRFAGPIATAPERDPITMALWGLAERIPCRKAGRKLLVGEAVIRAACDVATRSRTACEFARKLASAE